MKKIDKTLREVRSWKRKAAARTKGMTTKEVVAYFRSVSAQYKTRKRSVA
jgi:hypothetical protein